MIPGRVLDSGVPPELSEREVPVSAESIEVTEQSNVVNQSTQ